MPHIDVNLYPGRTKEMKQEIAQKLVAFLSKECGMPEKSLSVSFSEYAAEEFADKVAQKVAPEDVYISSEFLKK
ncbi:4-oxalocrotonate tautomerase family protein [Desulfovibrio sp. OttesenSCG-928-C06]|nr:4-oxalocrotonate tautomerase family protein [Desulfovibrio sp. OttesenSCG-928-C06]